MKAPDELRAKIDAAVLEEAEWWYKKLYSALNTSQFSEGEKLWQESLKRIADLRARPAAEKGENER